MTEKLQTILNAFYSDLAKLGKTAAFTLICDKGGSNPTLLSAIDDDSGVNLLLATTTASEIAAQVVRDANEQIKADVDRLMQMSEEDEVHDGLVDEVKKLD